MFLCGVGFTLGLGVFDGVCDLVERSDFEGVRLWLIDLLMDGVLLIST